MHHLGRTRARAINLHFIIFYDAFNNDAVPADDPGRAGGGKKGWARFHRPCTLRRWPLPCNFILINPPFSHSHPPSLTHSPPPFGLYHLRYSGTSHYQDRGLKRTRIPGRFSVLRAFSIAFDEYRASIAFRSALPFGKFCRKTCDSDYNHNCDWTARLVGQNLNIVFL